MGNRQVLLLLPPSRQVARGVSQLGLFSQMFSENLQHLEHSAGGHRHEQDDHILLVTERQKSGSRDRADRNIGVQGSVELRKEHMNGPGVAAGEHQVTPTS